MRTRGGTTEALGENGMSQLIERLFARARIRGYTGHDLRRTFGQLISDVCEDDFITERLLRHVIPGTGDRYYKFKMDKLYRALCSYSPIRQITFLVGVEREVQKVGRECKF
jgi:integrase